jgi:hypothetical protein
MIRVVRSYSLSANRGNNVLPPVKIMLPKNKIQTETLVFEHEIREGGGGGGGDIELFKSAQDFVRTPFIKYRVKMRMARIDCPNNALC